MIKENPEQEMIVMIVETEQLTYELSPGYVATVATHQPATQQLNNRVQ